MNESIHLPWSVNPNCGITLPLEPFDFRGQRCCSFFEHPRRGGSDEILRNIIAERVWGMPSNYSCGQEQTFNFVAAAKR